MDKVKVLIIDSGIDKFYDKFVSASYALRFVEGKYCVEETETIDLIGHGTAVASIVIGTNPNVDIISIKICDNMLDIDETGLIAVLQYVYDNINVDIINISAGITYIEDLQSLENLCNMLRTKGVTIVSAFDNDGAISYPAAFDSVLGVDTVTEYEDINELISIENSIVDILVPNRYYRAIWLKQRTIIKGTSFACAYITGIIAKEIETKRFLQKYDIKKRIATHSRVIANENDFEYPLFTIEKAIVFPINKETHSILRFSQSLPFEVVAVYDESRMGKIGKQMFGHTIESYDDINWADDFDTIILSYTSELEKLTKRQYVAEIIEHARKHRKQIYSFDTISTDYNRIYCPIVSKRMIPERNLLKLHKNIMPIVAVFGTSSKQGKFTLQYRLLSKLRELGYDVGFLATEPSGYLYGADEVFHFGYKASLSIQPWECIAILNEMIWNIQLKNKDLLITGCQSGTIHYDNSKIMDFAIYQYAYILGVMPDFPILCANPHDDLAYIKKSLAFINSSCEASVKAVVVFPRIATQTLSGIGYKVEDIRKEVLDELKRKWQKILGLPVYSLNDENVIDELCTMILNEYKTGN